MGAIFIALSFVSFSRGGAGASPATISEILSQNYNQSPFADPLKKSQPDWPEFILVDRSYLEANLPPAMITPQVLAQAIFCKEPDNDIQIHTVKKGESLWRIAKEYGLKMETVIWANNLRSSNIRPGQQLTILPTDGIIYTVKDGDTLERIAKKYKSEEEKIILFNELSSAGDIFKGQALIIPGGRPLSYPKINRPRRRTALSYHSCSSLSTNDFFGLSHHFPRGQCTWWVAQKRAIPWGGNAISWLNNAIAYGYPVCKGSRCTPQVGAVASVRTRSPLGHVVYVEKIKDNRIVFSEMNYIGWCRVDHRSLPIGSWKIRGYIYQKY